MSYYAANSKSWQIGTSDAENFLGDFGNVTRSDVFQIGGSETGTVGGVNNNWDTFDGGLGSDQIYVAPKSGYYWTAIMLANNGLHNVEIINFNTNGPKPIYFAGTINFGDVTWMTPDTKIYGRENDNTFHGGNVGEYVEGDAGNDTLYGNGGDDTLFGDTADNPWAASWSAAGNDKLFGGAGNDTLHGQGGDDILNGGSGENFLWGEAGFDKFRFTDVNDHSRIEDFTSGDDTIQIDTSIASNYAALTIANGSDGNAHITAGTVDITVVGVLASALNASHFDFGLFV